MTYGLMTRGDAGNVQIDGRSGVLNVLAEGSYAGYGSSSGEGTLVTFPAAIATQAPPLLFLNPDTAAVNAGRVDLALVRPVGSPGNWTGFRVRGRYVQYPHTGKYFAAGMAPSPSADGYGLRLWDGSGQQIFDSGHRLAKLIGPAGKWKYKGALPTPTGLSRHGWSSPWQFGDDAYLLVSPFATELTVANRQVASINLEFSANKTEALLSLTTLPGVWTNNDFWMPALGGRISA